MRGIAGALTAVALLVSAGVVGAAPAGATTPPQEGVYVGHDDAGHAVELMASHHHVGNLRYGPHGHISRSVFEIDHRTFHGCAEDVCLAGVWSHDDVVIGAWWHDPRHHPEHTRTHTFRLHLQG